MHYAKITVLFAGAAAAQSSAVLLNLFEFDSTLTFKAAESSTTTYENVCNPTSTLSGGSSSAPLTSLPSAIPNPTGSGIPIPSVPATTARAVLRRQDDNNDDSICEPYTLIQGPETWQFHLTDPTPGVKTIDANCGWKGQLLNATLTCTASTNGTALKTPGVTTSEIGPSALSSLSVVQMMTIVGASTTVEQASTTPTGTQVKSTGVAPRAAMPTGLVGLVGGAAGLLAAALAL